MFIVVSCVIGLATALPIDEAENEEDRDVRCDMGWEVGCDGSDIHSDCLCVSVVEPEDDNAGSLEVEALLVVLATSVDTFGGVCKCLKYG